MNSCSKLINVHYSEKLGIYIVASRSDGGPYIVSGEIEHLPFEISSNVLGKCILNRFLMVDGLTALDDNPDFYKKAVPGVKSWKQFLKKMELVTIYKNSHCYCFERYKQSYNYYEAYGDKIELSLSSSAFDLGQTARALIQK